MKRVQESESWTVCQTLEDLLVSWEHGTHRLMLLHSASTPGRPEPRPALVEVDDLGVISSIRRIRGDWV